MKTLTPKIYVPHVHVPCTVVINSNLGNNLSKCPLMETTKCPVMDEWIKKKCGLCRCNGILFNHKTGNLAICDNTDGL